MNSNRKLYFAIAAILGGNASVCDEAALGARGRHKF